MKPGVTLHENFERTASRFPESVAVTDGRTQLTYRELDERAERLAGALRAAGAGRDQRVGLCVERGAELVVGLLGILKAGAGYVPVDPAYPAERREFVLGHCDSGLVVAHAATASLVEDRRVVRVDALPEAVAEAPAGHQGADAESLAYVIFTSGSTGEPKGVEIEHRNAVRLFTATAPVFAFDETDVWTNFHSTAFDFSVWEIWGALFFGGRLVIVDRDTARDPQAFLTLLRRERVTVLNQTPSAFRNLIGVDEGRPLDLRYVIFGGEKLDYRSLKPWVERHGIETPALVNMYGITETTVHVTWKVISEADLAGEGDSLIGRPIADLRLAVLDESGAELPIGAEGGLHVAGAGVARGYLGHPELTAERFVERTLADGSTERWYDSGDRGVQTAPGQFAYAGRADRQVKIRGYRVEPGEIETVLEQHPAVRDAVVLVADFGSGDPRLVAYPVVEAGTDAEALAAELKEAVAAALPAYMAPSTYLALDELPVTVNGKLDESVLRKRLELRLAEAADSAREQSAAGGSVEDALRGIWAEVLGTGDAAAIADGDEFFDLGGTSFSLIHMLSVVNDRYRLSLNVGTLAEGANIAALAAAVKNQLALTSR
ncbi:amino acid adenylation domain-containing protein [Streptomyces sp. NPDC054835]|uniref:amino acid adenylation domain-containing protein n=1 Tax=Streptomyces sp. NBC_01268 TaxID=2903806 RepID=UPI002E32911D|nr:amino acid adenylation domain-containing protein [Streptomyces sp. NBC_01268]